MGGWGLENDSPLLSLGRSNTHAQPPAPEALPSSYRSSGCTGSDGTCRKHSDD